MKRKNITEREFQVPLFAREKILRCSPERCRREYFSQKTSHFMSIVNYCLDNLHLNCENKSP